MTDSAPISGVPVAGGWTGVDGKEVDITLSNYSYRIVFVVFNILISLYIQCFDYVS